MIKCKRDKFHFSLFIALLTCSSATFAFQNEPEKFEAPSEQQVKQLDEEIERIEVTGDLSLYYFGQQARKSELDFYKTFNDLNDRKEFAIRCRGQAPTGSRIKKRFCQPQYKLDAMAHETQQALQKGVGSSFSDLQGVALPTYKKIDVLTRDKQNESLIYLEELVEKHPELKQKLLTMVEKQALFEQKKAERD